MLPFEGCVKFVLLTSEALFSIAWLRFSILFVLAVRDHYILYISTCWYLKAYSKFPFLDHYVENHCYISVIYIFLFLKFGIQ